MEINLFSSPLVDVRRCFWYRDLVQKSSTTTKGCSEVLLISESQLESGKKKCCTLWLPMHLFYLDKDSALRPNVDLEESLRAETKEPGNFVLKGAVP